MGKWYTKPLTKRILVVTEATLSVLLIGAIIVLSMFSGKYSDMDYVRMINRDYTESVVFINDFYEYTDDVLNQIRREETYEKNGEFDLDNNIDILTFADKYYPVDYNNVDVKPALRNEKNELDEKIQENAGTVTSEDEIFSPIEYRLGDIVGYNAFAKTKSVIVCQKPDRTFSYYTPEEFIEIYSNKDEYIVEVDSEYGETREENFIINYLEDFKRLPDGGFKVRVKKNSGETLFFDCWNYPNSINDDVKTIYGESVLDIVNNYPEYNGRLVEIYNAYDFAMYTVKEDYEQYKIFRKKYSGNNINYRYAYIGSDGKTKTNDTKIKSLEDIKEDVNHYKYINITPYLSDFESNLDIKASEWKEILTSNTRDDACRFYAYIDTDFKLQDSFYNAAKDYKEIRFYVVTSVLLGMLATILLIALTVIITLGAGRKYGDDELHLMSFDSIKTEIAAAVIIVPSVMLAYLIVLFMVDPYNLSGDLLAVIMLIIFVIIMLSGYLSLVRRLKAGTMWKNSILKMVCKFISEAWNNRTVIIRSLILAVALVLVNMIAYLSPHAETIIIATLLNIVFIVGSVLYTIDVAKVKKGLKEISNGNLEYKIDENNIKGPLKETAETINNIGVGMKNAVDEKISSERLKTDLITNVSHDIKTPLTSIINYVDILKREDIKDEKIKGYIDILDQKSKRLKTLTEDVLEASKASSGNIKLEMQNLDIVELLRQSAGEFGEKMTANDLTLVCSFPSQPAIIYADGRRMWRIFENTLNNAVKYSMKGTRVYLDVKVKDNEVYVVIKNISAYQLNISADQLTERFVRGDISRTTEGTGLGLSISRSLTELQGGKFEIYLDGDLFKVTTIFPLTKEEAATKDE